MAKKMTLVPTKVGLMYECYYCKSGLTPEQADSHVCIECEWCGNALINGNCPDLECDVNRLYVPVCSCGDEATHGATGAGDNTVHVCKACCNACLEQGCEWLEYN